MASGILVAILFIVSIPDTTAPIRILRLTALPSNIHVPERFRPSLERLLLQSPTLRRQCQRIGDARHVRVFIRTVPPSVASLPRARAKITRYESGALLAEIDVPILELAELLAHELEHVIEQMEGVNLAHLAREGAIVAFRDESGAYETARATAAGRAAAAEVRLHQAASTIARRR